MIGSWYMMQRWSLPIPQQLLHLFSSEKRPSLWQVVPALEELQTTWEKKAKDPHYRRFHYALLDGLNKIAKYYNKLDEKPSFVLALGKSILDQPVLC